MPRPLPNERPNATGEIQMEMDGLETVLNHRRANLTPDEAGAALNMSGRQIRNLIEEGYLAAFSIGMNGENAERKHLRVLRHSVLAFWYERYLMETGVEVPWGARHRPEVINWREHLRAKATLTK